MPTFLTERQKSILEFIRRYHRREGISPTYREIRDQFGYSSYGTVRKHLRLLEEKGYLRHISNQKRGLELLDPESQSPATAEEIPFFGLIAAGKPIEAVAGDETLAVPEHLLGGSRGDCFVLKVVGESMIDEGIFDGDLVVVRRRELASTGEMVVALVGEEVTLKRFYPEGERIRLEPSNPAMEPIWVAAGDLSVQGIVVGLMRKF